MLLLQAAAASALAKSQLKPRSLSLVTSWGSLSDTPLKHGPQATHTLAKLLSLSLSL